MDLPSEPTLLRARLLDRLHRPIRQCRSNADIRKVFGAEAVQVTSLVLLALFCVLASICAGYAGAGRRARFGAPLLGCLAAVGVVASTPSLFDTFGWFNSVAIYFAAVVASVGVVAWVGHVATAASGSTAKRSLASLAVGFVAAGFTEVMGLVIVAGALLAAANAAAMRRPGEGRKPLIASLSAIALGAAIGVGVIFVGPVRGCERSFRARARGSAGWCIRWATT
jgi:hypothetical protein